MQTVGPTHTVSTVNTHRTWQLFTWEKFIMRGPPLRNQPQIRGPSFRQIDTASNDTLSFLPRNLLKYSHFHSQLHL